MRIGAELNLPEDDTVHLYYALLLMDAGCTAWTSQFATFVLGNEMAAHTEFVFHVERSNPLSVLGWMREHVASEESAPRRARHTFEFMLRGPAFAREGFRNTCEVAQRFAARRGLSDDVQQALLSVFEQWDGSGPRGLRHFFDFASAAAGPLVVNPVSVCRSPFGFFEEQYWIA